MEGANHTGVPAIFNLLIQPYHHSGVFVQKAAGSIADLKCHAVAKAVHIVIAKVNLADSGGLIRGTHINHASAGKTGWAF